MTDEEYCISILPKVSRTFALSIEALPEPLRTTIRVSYLLCRIVDTIEDDLDLSRKTRRNLFSKFIKVVDDDQASVADLKEAFSGWRGTDDRELCRNIDIPIRIFRKLDPDHREATRPHIVEMARGMADYSERWQGPAGLTVLTDVHDLETYCYYVAGTVGNLLTDVFTLVEKNLPPQVTKGLKDRSVSFGLGLQMTNIVKDITDDRERGWCFLPQSVCSSHSIDPIELIEPQKKQPALSVVNDVVDLARQHLDDALEYTLLLPSSARDVRLFVLVPLVLALATLTLVEGNQEVLVPGKDVKITRDFLASALQKAHSVVQDNNGIRELCRNAAAMSL